LGPEERSFHVHAHELLVLVGGHLEKFLRSKETRVIDEHVDAAELLGFVERRLEIVDAGDVAIDVRRRRLGFVGNQFVSRRSVFAWLFAHVGDDDVGPVVGERPRDRSSDSARFTGHDGRLFRE